MNDFPARSADDAEGAEAELWRSVVEHAPDAILLLDRDFRCLALSAGACEMSGYAPEEVEGKPIGSFWDPDEFKVNPFPIERLRAGETVVSERKLRRKDGSRVDLESRARMLPDGRTVVVGRDVTERKEEEARRRQAEEALRASEERFRALIENSADVFSIVDASGTVRYTSPSMRRVFGHDPEGRRGRSGFELVHPDDRDLVVAMFRDGIARGGATVRAEFRYRHADGSWRVVEASARNLLEHPAVAAAVVTLRDITERRQTELQLASAERLAAIGRLAGAVAHEFNNVLMSIQPFTELVDRLADDPRIHEAAAQIARAVRRGTRVSDDILRFTQISKPSLATVDLNEWARRAVESIRPAIGHGVTIAVEALEGPAYARADEAQLTQMLANLLVNAADAMPHGGEVRIRLWVPDSDAQPFGVVHGASGKLVLTIADQGDGIPPENIGHVFEPLFTTKPNGRGLGLAVAHQIAESHGGAIFVESRLGAGSSFHVVLRRSRPEAAGAAAGEQEGALRPKRILLVEDEAPIAEGTAALLRLDGFDVEIARTGGGALDALRAAPFDAVVLDVGLPDLSGIDLYRTIERSWPSLPVIFSTGHADPQKMDEIGSSRVRFLRKPYEHGELVAMLGDVLAGRR